MPAARPISPPRLAIGKLAGINGRIALLTGHFEVGKDDHPVGLTYEEIEFMVKTILHEDTSPLSLQFRILPDLSVLKQDTRMLQPFKKDGVWYYAVLYSLTCYASLKYRGSGSTAKYDNYTAGSRLWSISAKYGYEISEVEAIQNSNKPFHHKGRSVYYRTEQPGKEYKLEYVDVEDFSNSLEKFLYFYAELNDIFSQVSTWIDQKLDAMARCKCGHNGKIDYFKFLNKLKKIDALSSLKSHLKCTLCGGNSTVMTIPLYSEYTPRELIHNTAWINLERSRREIGPVVRNSELEEMYDTLGGDGDNAVYLSDGAYLSPNGEISED